MIGAAAGQRHLRRPVARRHVGQNGDGFRHRLAHVLARQHHAAIDIAAQVLDHREALIEIEGLGARRRVARGDQVAN